MSDANSIMDKIREEHEKGLPSKRKILSYLLDLLNKDKYPSLSDIEFYDIVGETYKLNLDYKLNLKMLFYPIYNALKKKIKKLYGDEKRLEMEQYLIKNFGLFGTEHILNKIREEFEKTPSEDLNSLYWDLRQRMGKKNRLIIDKYITEKYNLIDGEHIIYGCNGNIKLVGFRKGSLSVTSGSIFLTNYRIIAQGIRDAKGALTLWGIAKTTRRPEATELLLESSLTYGYQFPIRNHINLKKRTNGVSYSCIQNNQSRLIWITLPLETSQAKREEQIDIIFKILSKDVNHIKDTIKVSEPKKQPEKVEALQEEAQIISAPIEKAKEVEVIQDEAVILTPEEKLVEEALLEEVPSVLEEIPKEVEVLPEEVVVVSKPDVQPKELVPPEPKIINCPFCGLVKDETAIFCSQCGRMFKKK